MGHRQTHRVFLVRWIWDWWGGSTMKTLLRFSLLIFGPGVVEDFALRALYWQILLFWLGPDFHVDRLLTKFPPEDG